MVTRYMASDDTSMLISSYYNSYRERDIVRFVLKIYDSSNLKEKEGYIVCDIDSKVLEKIMDKYFTNEEMYIWLQPAGDRPLYAIGMLGTEFNNMLDEIETLIGQQYEDRLLRNKAEYKALQAQTSDYTTAMAAIVISVLPIAVLFMSLQKYFIKGMTVGAVKG